MSSHRVQPPKAKECSPDGPKASRCLCRISSAAFFISFVLSAGGDEGLPACLKNPSPGVCNPYNPPREKSSARCVHFEHPRARSHSHDELMSAHLGAIPRHALTPLRSRDSGLGNDCWSDAALTDDRLIHDDGFVHVVIEDVPCQAHGCCSLPYALRPNSLDMQSLWNFFGQSEYKFMVDMQSVDPVYILDVGGIGMSAIWLSLLYPNAKIIRMDPNPDNFATGLYNSRFFPNITQINLGLWNKQTTLQMCERPGWKTLAFFTREADDPPCEIPVPGVEVGVGLLSNIMKTFNIPSFDIIKMDIEGAELQVFEEETIKGIVANSTVFAIELHERYVANSEAAVRDVFADLPFQEFWDDENTVWVSKAFMQLHGCSASLAAD